MAFPPLGGELVQPVIESGDITGYYRVRVHQADITEEQDLWVRTDDVLPGEFQAELAVGDYRTRNGADWLAELMTVSPTQFASLMLEAARFAQDQTGIAIRN
jgi:hypothetical protein